MTTRTTRLHYFDGFVTHFMTDEQLKRWFEMNNENDRNIKAIETQELCSKEQVAEILKRFGK